MLLLAMAVSSGAAPCCKRCAATAPICSSFPSPCQNKMKYERISPGTPLSSYILLLKSKKKEVKHTPPLCQRWERGDLLSFSQTDASPSSYIFQAHPQLGPLLSPKPRALLPWAGRSHQHRKRQKSPSHRMQGGGGKGVRMPCARSPAWL